MPPPAIPTAETIQATLAALRIDEGCRRRPYLDSKGIWTVGYGHNLTVNSLSQEACEVILRDDLAEAILAADRYEWFPALSPVRQAVILNMLFNLGAHRFDGFIELKRALASGDYARASDEMLASAWAVDVGARAARLAAEMRRG